MRIGEGFDVHAFAPGRELYLCGVRIPWEQGLQGHSDADVAIHALCDALLGAAGLGDIGLMFPDTDPAYKGIRSTLLLERVVRAVEEAGYKVGNADVTIIAQAPKIRPYVDEMKRCLAGILGVQPSCVNIKGTTTEKLGFTGRKEGIAALAVALLENRQQT